MSMGHGNRATFHAHRFNPTAAPEPDVIGSKPELMVAHHLLGNIVYSQDDEDLGNIKDIILDVRGGRLAYAVLSFGGFLDMGETLFAVPWGALALDTENKRFVLNVDKARLKDAPGFHKDRWPGMEDPSWQREIHSYYGTKVCSNDMLVGRGHS